MGAAWWEVDEEGMAPASLKDSLPVPSWAGCWGAVCSDCCPSCLETVWSCEFSGYGAHGEAPERPLCASFWRDGWG